MVLSSSGNLQTVNCDDLKPPDLNVELVSSNRTPFSLGIYETLHTSSVGRAETLSCTHNNPTQITFVNEWQQNRNLSTRSTPTVTERVWRAHYQNNCNDNAKEEHASR